MLKDIDEDDVAVDDFNPVGRKKSCAVGGSGALDQPESRDTARGHGEDHEIVTEEMEGATARHGADTYSGKPFEEADKLCGSDYEIDEDYQSSFR